MLHLERALDGLPRLIPNFERRAPEHHDVVTVVLVHGAFVTVHDVHHTVEVPVEVAEQRGGSHRLGERREPADVAEEHRHPLLLAAEREFAGLFTFHDRARDGRCDEATEGAARPRDRELFLDEEIPEQDDPPEGRRDNIGDGWHLDRPLTDGPLRLDREDRVRTDDVQHEEHERAEEAEKPPTQNEHQSREREQEELEERRDRALSQHRIPVRQDRLDRVRPDLDAVHLLPARVRDRVVVRHRRE